MRMQLIAATLAFGAAIPAFAADAVVDEVVVVDSAYNWSGVYLGAQIGYAWGSSDVTDYRVEGPINSYVDGLDPDGFIGGAYVGYNFQMSNNLVVGIEGDFEYADLEARDFAIFPPGGPDPEVTMSSSLDWQGSVRARFGYAIDRWLPYLTAGVAFGGFDSTIDVANSSTSAAWSDTVVGYTVGAGVEYAFTDNLIGRAEYRFTDFGSVDNTWADFNEPVEADLTTSAIRLGIAYKF